MQNVVELRIKGETRQVNLPDGTKVWLNNGASIKYPKRFGAYQRDVWLNGEGYFEVMKNPDRPFIVNSNIARVKVLGTIFNFKIDNKRKEAIVSLISGKIKVTGAHGEGSTLLIPGQKAIVYAKTRNIIVEKANTRLDAVWHNGVIPFTNASIPDIATSLEHIYGVKIIVEKGVDTTHTYSGGIPLAANIDTALKHLCNTLPAKVKRTGEIIYLVP